MVHSFMNIINKVWKEVNWQSTHLRVRKAPGKLSIKYQA